MHIVQIMFDMPPGGREVAEQAVDEVMPIIREKEGFIDAKFYSI